MEIKQKTGVKKKIVFVAVSLKQLKVPQIHIHLQTNEHTYMHIYMDECKKIQKYKLLPT